MFDAVNSDGQRGELPARGLNRGELTRPARLPLGPLAVAAVCTGAYLLGELYLLGGPGLPLDDSWIHLQFARQLAAGEGLAYNPGRWISGSTAPLWTACLALVFLLPGSPILWAKVASAGFFLLTVDATYRFTAELSPRRGLALVAAGLVATSHWLIWSGLSGMEIGLFTWLSLWGMILHLRERRSADRENVDPERLPLALPVLALATLARPEGFLLLVLAALDRLLHVFRSADGLRLAFRPARSTLVGLGLAALVLVPTLVFYHAAGGSFLPTTFAVKAAPVADLVPNGRYLRAVLDVLARSQPVILLLAGAGALRLVGRLGRWRDRGLLPLLWPLGLALAYALTAPEEGPVVVGNFGRYYFPLLPVIVVLGCLGLEPLAGRLRWLTWRHLRLPLSGLLLTGLFLPQVWGVVQGLEHHARTVANVEDSDVAAARWLTGRLPPAALLAVQDIGALKFLLPNPILDLTGIVNPEILPYLKGSQGQDPAVYWEERLLAFLARERPDYLIVFPRSYPALTRAPGFVRIQGFAVEDNVTMAGDELVVFATPWNRFPLAENPTP